VAESGVQVEGMKEALMSLYGTGPGSSEPASPRGRRRPGHGLSLALSMRNICNMGSEDWVSERGSCGRLAESWA
jgi:hypothetical protein